MRAYYRALEAAVHDPSSENIARVEQALDPNCSCAQIVRVLRDEARRGRHADYGLTVTRLSVPNATTTTGTAHVTVQQSPGSLYDSSGHVVERISARTDTYFVDVRARGSAWRIVRVSEG